MRQQLYRRGAFALSALVLGVIGVIPASAQTGQQTVTVAGRGITMTPFMAMGDDYALGGGLSFSFPLARRFTLEAEGSLGTDAARSGVSMLVDLFTIGGFTTYVAGGAGVQRDEVEHDEFEPAVRNRPFDMGGKKTEFALGIGAGTTVPIGTRWSWRADFRWYNPKAEWPESWRVYNGLTLQLTQ